MRGHIHFEKGDVTLIVQQWSPKGSDTYSFHSKKVRTNLVMLFGDIGL